MSLRFGEHAGGARRDYDAPVRRPSAPPHGPAQTLMSGLLPWVFLSCLVYWTYLILTTRMIIRYDAGAYEALGRMFLEKGWGEYFRTGPNREPGYPLLVSFSMLLGQGLAVSYQHVQAFLQLCLLLISQLLALRTLRVLGVRESIIAPTILYLGISPAIVNSALSLFSEVVTLPLVLASVLFFHHGWLALTGPRSRIVRTATAAGLTLAALALCKAPFELLTPVLVLAFLLAGFLTRRPEIAKNTVLFAVVLAAVFSIPVLSVRLANRSFNGQFALTDRGDWLLYGSAARRTVPLTRERLLTALASIPGDGVCRRIFGSEKCFFWTFRTADNLGLTKRSELARQSGDAQEVSRALIRAAFGTIGEHPLQFALLSVVEGSKIFFWESTQIGFVFYPPGLARVFNWTPFKDGLRFLLALGTILGFAHLAAHSWCARRSLLVAPGQVNATGGILPFAVLFLICAYTGVYALVSVVTRYALPIAPLFLISIAFMIDARVPRLRPSLRSSE